jgi:hypothetical protein
MSNRPTIKLRSKYFTFRVPLGNGPILPVDGGPNIEERTRPGRPSLTTVTGQKLITLAVPAFWDGLADGQKENVKPDVMQVVDLATDLPAIDFTAEGPMPYSGMRFLMDWPEWGNLLPFPSGQGWLQAELVLKLVEFNDPQAIHARKVGHGRDRGDGDGGVRAPASIVLPRPMNLVEVAAQYAGDPGEAKAIGKANGIHDIKKKLPKGRHLTIPAG